MLRIDGLVEPELANVFRNLQYTSVLFNKYTTKTPVDGTLLRQSLGYIHSNLLGLEDRLTRPLSRCLRLGMMAFLSTTFRLPDFSIQHYSYTLVGKLQISYETVKASEPNLLPTLDIWLTLVLLISAENSIELDTITGWEINSAYEWSWHEARRHLKQVMWIELIHDRLGRVAFERMMG
jgi:hypothetical protein